MSYLLQYARRPDRIASCTSGFRVDEYTRLNRPGLYGDAFVRVFVGDSTAGGGLDPDLVLQIADCTNTVNLEFSLETQQLCENSLFKIETLIAALQGFRDGLAAEAQLAERRRR